MSRPLDNASPAETAAKIVALLLRHGITAAELSNATVDDWRLAAYAAGVTTPGEAARAMVICCLASSGRTERLCA